MIKILDFVRSQNNGLEANLDDEVENRNPFDYSNISSLPEGEDSPSNFFNLLSKALPIDQINKMLQQELERRRKALSSYLVKCNEARGKSSLYNSNSTVFVCLFVCLCVCLSGLY